MPHTWYSRLMSTTTTKFSDLGHSDLPNNYFGAVASVLASQYPMVQSTR